MSMNMESAYEAGEFDGHASEAVETEARQEYHEGHSEYVVFESEEKKEEAKKLLDEHHQTDGRLTYFLRYEDNENQNCLQIIFSKTSQDQWRDLKDFFKEHGLRIEDKDIHTVDPKGNETHH